MPSRENIKNQEIQSASDVDETNDEVEDEVDEGMDMDGDDGIEGFGFDAGLLGGAFDPMMTFGQFVTAQNGETIPDILEKINETLSTLTKVLHKISKTLDKK